MGFVNCAQAKLKSHIRDPNAPELVHFLFTPLALVIDASCGDEQGDSASELASRAIAPLPTPESHELLDNCLSSKENELLRSLGPAWTTSV
jgi:epidermal growth factor receptor kinase substrate 8